MQNTNDRYIQEDEIDLRELFNTILKRKWFILIFTAVITLGSIVWALTRTPIYEAKALIEIGNYKLLNNSNSSNNSNKELLDNSLQLVKKLNILFIDMRKNEKNQNSEIVSINVPKKSNSFIEIVSNGISNELAEKEIDKVIVYIQSEHKKILDDVKLRRELEIKNIDTRINSILTKSIPLLDKKISLQEKTLLEFRNQIKSIDRSIKQIEGKNPSLAALRLMEKRDLTIFVVNLNTQLMDMKDKQDTLKNIEVIKLEESKILLNSLLLPHNYKNTNIVGKVITNDYPIKPKKKLIVVVSFVTSFILSIFIVFMLEFINNMKIKKEDDEK